MWFPTETPYSAAASAAHRFLKECICPEAELRDIGIPAPMAELSAPIGVRYGVTVGNGALNAALASNMPIFGGIKVFRGAYEDRGYVNFDVSDEFMLRFAESVADVLPAGCAAERMILPVSAEYAHARLLNYSVVYENYIPSPAKRRALWMCLGLLEKRTPVKQRRAYAAAVHAVTEALPNDEGRFGGSAAKAMAALIKRGV